MPSTSKPELVTDRLLLRRFCFGDAAAVQRLAGDPAVAEMTLSIPHPYPEGAAEAWIAGQEPDRAAGVREVFAVVERAQGELVGAIGLAIRSEHSRAELGYWIGRPYWGRGYATEAARAVLSYAFGSLGLNRVHACHFARNPASGRVMAKAGMGQEGCQRGHIIKDGRVEDLILFGATRKMWQEWEVTAPPR